MTEYKTGKIYLEITEKETTDLDDKSEVENIVGKGTLRVINPSSENRLWNLKLEIANKDFTDLPASSTKEALEPNSSWDFEYTINNIKEPILRFQEIIDTSKNEEGINHNFVVGSWDDETSLTFIVTNISGKPIYGIELNKQIPLYLKNLKVSETTIGEAQLDLETKKFKWKIEALQPEETAKVTVTGNPSIEDSAEKSGNNVEITYYSTDQTRSGIEPKIEALTNTMTGVDQEEDDSKPGWWNCEVEFDNESDFELTLKTAKVIQKVSTGEDVLLDLQPNEIVAPGSSWSHEFQVESPTVPSLQPILEFTANYETPKKIVGKIVKKESIFKVLQTEITKDINPPTVKANANTDMVITNTITNVGTANIDKIILTDVIPKDFEPPSIDQIELTIIGEMGENKAKLDVKNSSITIEPDDKSITSPHTITIEFFDLNELFTPKSKLVMKYPIIARNPQPNTRYETPVTINSYTMPRGPGYKDQCKEVPVIGIQYVKRKLKTMKSISPAGREGAYNVVIKINNKGGVELQKITVIETIPEGFTAGEFQPANLKPEYKEDKDGAKIIWTIDRIDPDQSIKLKYVSEGSGEFPRLEPQVIIAEPESLKSRSSPTVAPSEVSDEEFKSKNAGLVAVVFEEVVVNLKKGIKYDEAASIIEKMRDDLLEKGKSSPVLHEIMNTAKELRKLGEKALIGEGLDELLKKIEEWKSNLI